jgi:virginiamycin B lyase
VLNTYPLPNANAAPWGITAGPDGNLWFAELGNNAIGVMSTSGVLLNEFTLPNAGSGPIQVEFGPDLNLWITQVGFPFGSASRIQAMNQAGAIVTTFEIPGAFPLGLTVGPADTIWCAEAGADQLCEITDLDIPTTTTTTLEPTTTTTTAIATTAPVARGGTPTANTGSSARQPILLGVVMLVIGTTVSIQLASRRHANRVN